MCYQTKDVILAMQKDSGLRVSSLQVDGGAVVNDFLCQFQADLLGIPVVRPTVIEITSLGAAYLAGLSVGYWKGVRDIEKCWAQDRTFAPAMKKTDRDSLYQGWLKAVSRTRS
jgi:glycerol kinase